jgi:PEGA domain
MQLKMQALPRFVRRFIPRFGLAFATAFPIAFATALGTMAIVVATAAPAHAAPDSARSKYRAAEKLSDNGADAEALVVIEEGLKLDPRYQALLTLKSSVLVRLGDFEGAYATNQALLDAGIKGPTREAVLATMKTLEAILATVLEVTVLPGGPVAIFVKDKPFCVAAPTCKKALRAGQYTVTAQREGFAPWTGPVTIVLTQSTRLEIKLTENPSLLTVKPTPSDAAITVDGAAFPAPALVAAGSHQVTIAMVGYATARREVTASLGKPIELQLALEPSTPARIVPETATLLLDGQPIALDNGGLSLPAGKHVLVIRAEGYRERKETIPATRPAGYKIDVALASTSGPSVARGKLFTPRRKIAVASAGVSVLAIGAGVYLGLDARKLEDDSFALCPQPTSCREADRANDLIDRADSRALQANIAYGVAAAAAVGAVVLWVTGAEHASGVAVIPRLSPVPGSSVAGVDLSLTF